MESIFLGLHATASGLARSHVQYSLSKLFVRDLPRRMEDEPMYENLESTDGFVRWHLEMVQRT